MNQRYCNGMVHVIKQGDNLYQLSRRYRVPLGLILRANPYVDVYNLQPGQEICIPVARPYPGMMRPPFGPKPPQRPGQRPPEGPRPPEGQEPPMGPPSPLGPPSPMGPPSGPQSPMRPEPRIEPDDEDYDDYDNDYDDDDEDDRPEARMESEGDDDACSAKKEYVCEKDMSFEEFLEEQDMSVSDFFECNSPEALMLVRGTGLSIRKKV